MNIYNYFVSRDVAAHCKKLEKTWNTLEMAVIVYMSRKHLAEKHRAYRELISEYADMPVPKNPHGLTGDSVHHYLRGLVEQEERYLEYFMTPESGTAYNVTVNDRQKYDDCVEHSEIFSSVEKALEYARKSHERGSIKDIAIYKRILDSDKYVTVAMNYSGKPIEINSSYKLQMPEVPEGSIDFPANFYIDVPAPFKKGDICVALSGTAKGLVVIELTKYNNSERHSRNVNGDGDFSDMSYYGYQFMGDELFWDWNFQYTDLEYYRGKLTGKERLLQCVSWLLKDEIDIGAFSVTQNKIMMAHWLEKLNTADDMGYILPENKIF